MSHDTAVPDAIPFRTLGRPSGAILGGLAAMVVIGIAAVLIGAAGAEPERVWQGLLFNWLFWSSLAIGMVMFAVALHVTAADWAWSIRRFALGGAAFLPISLLLLVPVFFGYEHYFHHWLHAEGDPVIDAKAAWLNLPFMVVRDFAAVIILFGLALTFFYYAVRPDLYQAGQERHRSLYARFTRNYRGVQEEAALSFRQMNRIAPVLAILYALLWGMIGIDLAMTMEPHWFSTMFPVTFFWAAFHGGVAATAIAVAVLRPRLGLESFITVRQFHDLGKLVFAFSVFWMYINWSQYIVIWYGLLPHEQKFFAIRFAEPYSTISLAVVLMVFVIPFFGLLTRPPKLVPQILAFFGGLILLGYWLERFMITVPSIWEGDSLPLGLLEIGIGLGFGGLFLAAYTWYLSNFPLLPSPATLGAAESPVVAVPVPEA